MSARSLRSKTMCAFTTDFDRANAGYSPDRVDVFLGLHGSSRRANAERRHLRVDAPASRGGGQQNGRTQQAQLRHRLGRTHDGNPKAWKELDTACLPPAVHASLWPMSLLRLAAASHATYTSGGARSGIAASA